MSNQLPDNDTDLKLARKIGHIRAKGESLASIDDPLVTKLLQYKQQRYAGTTISSPDKEQVWQRIQSEVKSPNSSEPYRLVNASAIRWAAAAILLIAAIFSVLYVQFLSRPTLITESESFITSINLPDGSSVTLRPHSKLWALEQEPPRLQYRLEGEAKFEVEPQRNQTFTVQTDKGEVSVLGTAFTLSSWGNKMQVFLEEGTVKVRALEADTAVVLRPGEAATVTQKKGIPEVQTAEIQEFTDWLNQQLVFNNQAVETVIHEIEQEFDISVTLSDTVKSKKISGQLSLQNLSVVLEDLEIVLGGEFTKLDERRYRFVLE